MITFLFRHNFYGLFIYTDAEKISLPFDVNDPFKMNASNSIREESFVALEVITFHTESLRNKYLGECCAVL